MSSTTFEQGLSKLEQIVAELEQASLPLDLSLQRFNEGVQLAAFCSHKLTEARSQVDLLRRNQDGSLSAVPFSAANEH
jgi:exodeoxyribonuclease VII small subunit